MRIKSRSSLFQEHETAQFGHDFDFFMNTGKNSHSWGPFNHSTGRDFLLKRIATKMKIETQRNLLSIGSSKCKLLVKLANGKKQKMN